MNLVANYNILISPNLEKIIKKNLDSRLKKVFEKKLGYFKQNPYHPSLNTKKLNCSSSVLKDLGVDEVYEFYINRRDYRCVIYVNHGDQSIIVANVGNHNQIKRKYH